jgi:hypothetical protein
MCFFEGVCSMCYYRVVCSSDLFQRIYLEFGVVGGCKACASGYDCKGVIGRYDDEDSDE